MEALTYESIRSEADGAFYPRHLLGGCSTALVLFAAGFLGRQDAFWIAEAGLRATCVDFRGHLLEEMARVYPDGWQYVCGDVYDPVLLSVAAAESAFDLVSVDCPSGHFEQNAARLPRYCAIASKYVVLGTSPRTKLEAPEGWALLERIRRSNYAGGVEWAVLGRA